MPPSSLLASARQTAAQSSGGSAARPAVEGAMAALRGNGGLLA
jgi:hypothetical protein